MPNGKTQRERYQAGSVSQVGTSWVLRYYEREGEGQKRVRRSVVIGSTDEITSKRAALRRADVMMHEVNDHNRVVLFRHLCAQYELKAMGHLRPYSAVVYRAYTRRLCREFGDERVDFMATPAGIARVEDWISTMRSEDGKRPLAASTRSRFKAALALLFKYAMKCGHVSIQANPMRLIDIWNRPGNTSPRRQKTVLSVDQYHALMSDPELPQVCKIAATLMIATGLRPGEAFGLKWEDVDFHNQKISIMRSIKGRYEDAPKTDESRATVPMDEWLAEALRIWKAEWYCQHGYLFESPITRRPLYANALRDKFLHGAGLRIGIDHLGWYNFRHTHRAWMRQSGATLEEMRLAMRHASTNMTLIYGNDGIDHAETVRPANRRVVEMISKKASGQ